MEIACRWWSPRTQIAVIQLDVSPMPATVTETLRTVVSNGTARVLSDQVVEPRDLLVFVVGIDGGLGDRRVQFGPG
jgi:hypothetical protein